MFSLADSFSSIALQVVLSLLLIGVAVYSASGWMGRQDTRSIGVAPIRYFLGRFSWKPLMWEIVLLLALPEYLSHHLLILGVTHILVTVAYWMYRMWLCGQWRMY